MPRRQFWRCCWVDAEEMILRGEEHPPLYLELVESGELHERAKAAWELLRGCRLCPCECGVNRLDGEVGGCHTADRAVVSSHGPHFGEETPLVGQGGSGTIFFSGCSLHCVFCQNYSISQLCQGDGASEQKLARMMLSLQARGCHNINLVSPTHVVPQILEALEIAAESGLRLPLVYNSGGYDSQEVLKLLDGVVDIYMPDMKYGDAGVAERLSGVRDYPHVNRLAVKEMHRQVGDLQLDCRGTAWRGLLVRHLVLPGGLAGTMATTDFIAKEISPNTYVNIMDQYRPCYRARDIPGLARPVTRAELNSALEMARQVGLRRLDGFHI